MMVTALLKSVTTKVTSRITGAFEQAFSTMPPARMRVSCGASPLAIWVGV